ncbi:MAG: hydroxylase [Candidatus Raymondbacteria bacterium RifOxyA12_full_50_37]|nr:MAG: hydroxylase [Candidatus Raymondbacteria bacterium RifOxyA12_full_50_37]OGJ88524.1 MAG: hydroxylase [Candidatus Raymondbacteria bacterium RIFOXYA2_FULL_49_16]OGJ98985.1 MAG: hydroxylase [Candidatus Raymondbacteria bacterium RIFOXYC2_FULL_50_21]OGK00622.1 MAG: hydroxylase [Candidatus Raymondbacteria bacterium RifOxyC12_full_50_8]OGP41495.1 MAG: hydroxylase [Candidatus Raymondbacteria bacterium RIFOXYB2_FULL_49_35]
MKIVFDFKTGEVVLMRNDVENARYSMASAEGFELAAKAWLRCGWDAKYVYTFTWFGRPIIQLPDDILRIQEIIYSIKPDVIIETGVAHGGSLIFYASLCKAIGKGQVIGIDIEIRSHNKKAIEEHELSSYITLLEGSSVAPLLVEEVRQLVAKKETVLILLDSNHTRQHVLLELEAYAPLVTKGSFIVVTDGIMKDLENAPRSQLDWKENNPYNAAREFIAKNHDFIIKEPIWPFNESNGLNKHVATYWPGAWLMRIK